jgi:hypothetical protein
MAARAGFSATMTRQSRQARKGATVTESSGAGGRLARAVSNFMVANSSSKVVVKSHRSSSFDAELNK